MAGDCNLLSVGSAWSPIYKMTDKFGGHWGGGGSVKRTSGKCQNTSPTASIISTVPIDINNYSPLVLELKRITYSAWLVGPKSRHLVHEMIL